MTFPLARLAFAAAACVAAAAQAQTVKPPPLPPGHNLVKLEIGMSEPERKRHVRAHHHKFHHKKDYTRDDSIHGHESEVALRGGPVGAGQGSAAPVAPARGAGPGTVPGGAGTGPAREQTDKGASSWFYGQPDKK